MSVVGIDLGNKYAKIAQAKRGGVDLILNENSQRLNSVLVSFNGKERFIGESAVTQVRSNFKNTVTQIKRLIGRKFSDPDVQYEAANFLNYKIVEQPGDEIGIEVMYNDTPEVFTPQQILAMFLTKIRDLIETSTGAKSSDVVISVPPYFTDSQRLAVTNACDIAGVKCLRLLHDTTAAALAYGMFRSAKGEFDLEKETKVVFVCMGHSCFTVTVVGFVVGKLRVLSSASAPNAGGRNLDAAVAKHWAAEFETKTGVSVWEHPKSRIKLLEAAEKCKKNLSPWGVNTTPVNLECLHGDHDFRTNLTIETFEELAQPVVAEFEAPIRKAMADANVTIDDIDVVEILGGSMRPRVVKATVAKVLGVKGAEDGPGGYGLGSTMNMDECVARGCAFESAMISPLFRVSKTVEITDRVAYPIRVSWDIKDSAGDPAATESKAEDTLVLLDQGAATPTTKRITFKTVDPFTLDASYDASAHDLGLPAGADRRLGQYRIDGIPEDIAAAAKADPTKMPRIRIDFAHDTHGIFGLLKAELLKEAEEEGTDAAEGAAPAEGAEGAAAAAAEGAGSSTDAPAGAEGEAAAKEDAAAAPAAGDDAAAPATESEEPARKKKKRYQRVHLEATPLFQGGLTTSQVTECRNREAEMAKQDAEIRATQDKRNELETYIYQTRDALAGRLATFASDTDKTDLNAQLTTMEDWLYGDGFDTTKDVYQQQLDRLRLGGDPIFNRENESKNRDAYVAGLTSTIEWYKRVVTSTDPKYDHLEPADREKIATTCKESEDWLAAKVAEQKDLPTTVDPVLTLADLRQTDQKVKNVCHPIESKKKPEPPKEEAKAAEAAPDAPAADAEPATVEGSATAGDDSKMDVEPATAEEAAPAAAAEDAGEAAAAAADTDMANGV